MIAEWEIFRLRQFSYAFNVDWVLRLLTDDAFQLSGGCNLRMHDDKQTSLQKIKQKYVKVVFVITRIKEELYIHIIGLI